MVLNHRRCRKLEVANTKMEWKDPERSLLGEGYLNLRIYEKIYVNLTV